MGWDCARQILQRPGHFWAGRIQLHSRLFLSFFMGVPSGVISVCAGLVSALGPPVDADGAWPDGPPGALGDDDAVASSMLNLNGRTRSSSSSRYVTPRSTDGVLWALTGRMARGFSFPVVASYWRALCAVPSPRGVLGNSS